jgi:Zn-finger nucleic acid-binding protein
MKSCPACRSDLAAAPQRPTLLGCSRCGGVWADNATSKQIVEKLDAELVKLADTAAELSAMRHRGPLPAKGGRRACPECQKTLANVHQASTHLDVCSEHGTWFDRGELSRVVKILAHERDLKDPKWRSSKEYRVVEGTTSLNAAGPAPAYQGPSGGEVVAEVGAEVAVGAVFLLLESLLD